MLLEIKALGNQGSWKSRALEIKALKNQGSQKPSLVETKSRGGLAQSDPKVCQGSRLSESVTVQSCRIMKL
jgi:hypothetical protein